MSVLILRDTLGNVRDPSHIVWEGTLTLQTGQLRIIQKSSLHIEFPSCNASVSSSTRLAGWSFYRGPITIDQSKPPTHTDIWSAGLDIWASLGDILLQYWIMKPDREIFWTLMWSRRDGVPHPHNCPITAKRTWPEGRWHTSSTQQASVLRALLFCVVLWSLEHLGWPKTESCRLNKNTENPKNREDQGSNESMAHNNNWN
jgi:hypothetical protein